ncbi:MAG TPA: glutamate mutase L [Roseiflexaceae bacterium]|nr:glutamate mutase L [Roseiflexaceae bacterium]
MSAPNPRAALVAEIGSVTTRVTLVDAVDGEARLIGQAEVPSTVEPPHADALVAIVSAAEQIGETTGRRLVEDGRLIIPQNHERDGVSTVVAITSAAGQLGVVVAAVAADVSARSALRASRATYTGTLEVVTLDDAARGGELHDATWIERQVEALTGMQPDVVIIAGGLENGAEDALVRLAHIVGLTALTTRVDAAGQQRQDVTLRPVIYAGNSAARERVIEALSGKAELTVVENIRPAIDDERLTPARRELSRLYDERILPTLPGAAGLRRLSAAPLRAVCDAHGLMARFVAERYRRAVLALDVGAANTSAHLASPGRFSPAVLGGVGVGHGLGAVLAERGQAALARWLPFQLSERELTHRLLNKMLRPHIPPVTREDLLIEHAVAREALTLALVALLDERPDAVYDLVIAGGGVLAHAPHPGLAALTVLDALQPSASESVLAIELHLDALGLLGACGALAFADPDAALTLFERDLLRNTPLATCVVALGDGRPGAPALEAELTVTGGGTQRVQVAHGKIALLPLPAGRTAQLTLRPAGGVRIGRNAPGAEVSSEQAAIKGSALGVVIDARGRPLQLPSDPAERQLALWDWLVALGVEREPLPYSTAEPPPDAPVSMIRRPSQPRISEPRISEPRISEPSQTLGGPRSLEGDLARLRQTVEEPKKKGFFRRK